MNDIQILLLRLVASALFGTDVPAMTADPAPVLREAAKQGVLMLAAKNLDASALEPGFRREILGAVKEQLSAGLALAAAHSGLSLSLEAAGIPHVIIKGSASAEYYPEPELRNMGDVDFYVDPADVNRTEELLLNSGFEPEKLSHDVHHVFTKDGCRYELHFGIPGVPDGDAGERCRFYLSDILSKSSLRDTPFGRMRLPCAFHHGMVLLLHTAHHLTKSGVGLRHLCDWAAFVGTDCIRENFSETFEKPLKETGLWKFALCLNDICVRHLGCPGDGLPADADHGLADELLLDILAGGNLGQKNVRRSREAYLVTSGSGTGSKVKRAWDLLSDMVRQKFPPARRFGFLVPFMMVYYGAVFLVRAALGKRPKLKLKQTIKAADERTKIYDRLELFSSEFGVRNSELSRRR